MDIHNRSRRQNSGPHTCLHFGKDLVRIHLHLKIAKTEMWGWIVKSDPLRGNMHITCRGIFLRIGRGIAIEGGTEECLGNCTCGKEILILHASFFGYRKWNGKFVRVFYQIFDSVEINITWPFLTSSKQDCVRGPIYNMSYPSVQWKDNKAHPLLSMIKFVSFYVQWSTMRFD